MASPVETLIRNTVAAGVEKISEFNRAHKAAPAAPHPFLTGIHTPMTQEATLTDLAVSGTIPPELDGTYIRIGPNPASPPNPGTYHWFTGDGMVHGVRIRGGKALWYRNRWIRSNRVSTALGEAPAPGPRNGKSDTVNTNVIGHAGKIWGLVEAGGYPVELDAELSTRAHNPFENTLDGSFSAHPHRDPSTGELHAICYSGRDQDFVRHVVVSTDGRVRREEPIRIAHGPMIHDCMITPHYVVVLDLPVTFNMKLMLAGHDLPYKWNPDHPARVGLLPREGRGDDIIWCDVDPCFVYHPCNGFETADGRVVLDVAVHKTMFANSTQGPDSPSGAFERWTIDPVAHRVDRTVIDDQFQEFPRLDERLTGLPYRYAYTVALPHAGLMDAVPDTALLKHDLAAGTREVHDFGAQRFPGEFVFVPRSADAAEDDGWLIGYVVDGATDTTDLTILDASRFGAPPVATITMPHRIPPGFHGNWIAA